MSEHKIELNRRAFISGAAALGALACINPTAAFAETAAEKQAEADAVRNKLIGLQADLEAAEVNYYAALDERDTAQQAMEAEQAKIDDATSKIESLQDRLGTRARSMYRSGSSSFLDFLLGASSFDELTQNWDLLNQMNENDSNMVNETKTLREELQAAKDEYARQKDVADQKAQEAAAIQADVQAKVDDATQMVNSLDAEARQLLEQEQAAAAIAAALQAQAAAASEAAAQTAGGGSAAAAPSGGNSGGGAPVVYPSGGGGTPGDGSGVVGYAMSRIGCPYVWGAEGPDSFDCSGLVTWAYRQIGIYLPHQSEAQKARATRVVPVSEARPGDVLWRYGHVGIAVSYGGAHYVHAPTFGALVRDTDSLSWSGFTAALQF